MRIRIQTTYVYETEAELLEGETIESFIFNRMDVVTMPCPDGCQFLSTQITDQKGEELATIN